MTKLLVACAMSTFAVLPINHGFAQTLPVCQSANSDSDGDGFGWENNASCRVMAAPSPNAPPANNNTGVAVGQCEDRGGFPWGWNPVTLESCRLDASGPGGSDQGNSGTPNNDLLNTLRSCTTGAIPDGICADESGNDLRLELDGCVDFDGDGWGVDDTGMCRANTNLVVNGSFEDGGNGWNTFLHPDSVAEQVLRADGSIIFDTFPSEFLFPPSSREGRVTFTYRDAGTEWFHSQLSTDPISLEGGNTYRLSFLASTPGPRAAPLSGDAVGSVVVENSTDFTKYLDRTDFDIQIFDQRYRFVEFFVPASDNNARVAFNLGDNFGGQNSINIGSLEIQDVILSVISADQQGSDQSLACIDSDGDGFGWNGVETCIPGGNQSLPAVEQSLVCVDEDGDGFGWTGTQSCRFDEQGNIVIL